MWNRTYYPKGEDHANVAKKWYIVDASNKRLGRLASSIAMHIRGKTEPTYTPSVDMGAYVIVVCSPYLNLTCWARLACHAQCCRCARQGRDLLYASAALGCMG